MKAVIGFGLESRVATEPSCAISCGGVFFPFFFLRRTQDSETEGSKKGKREAIEKPSVVLFCGGSHFRGIVFSEETSLEVS